MVIGSLKKTLKNFKKKFGDLFDLKRFDEALAYFTPVAIPRSNHFFAPLIAITGILIAIVTAGIALWAFFTLFTALLLLYFIITKVFGIQIEMPETYRV